MANKRCWICGDVADSKEHFIKRSDLVTMYGTRSYKNENEICLIRGDKQIPIQGVNSKHLKFEVLCKRCNDTKTQPFDQAYERFIQYITANKKDILHQRFIDFYLIYGDDFEAQQRSLYKYFVKSFGCRLSHFNHPIPEDMADLLEQDSFETGLRITFAVNEDKVILSELDTNLRSIGNGDIYVNQSYIDNTNGVLFYLYSEFYDWLHIYYWYNYSPDGNLGSTWIADNQFIYLGSFYSALSNEDRQEMYQKVIFRDYMENDKKKEEYNRILKSIDQGLSDVQHGKTKPIETLWDELGKDKK